MPFEARGQSYLPPSAEAPLAGRKIQWWYLGPVAGAPIAHVLVSGMGKAKTARGRHWFIAGIVLSTVTMIANRLYLMGHAGYPGSEDTAPDARLARKL